MVESKKKYMKIASIVVVVLCYFAGACGLWLVSRLWGDMAFSAKFFFNVIFTVAPLSVLWLVVNLYKKG